jgi:predicted ribosomally synthesized peptide with nif11-like leader
MIKASVTQFVGNVSLNETLQARLREASNLEGFLQVAQEYGYKFTVEDVKKFVEQQQSSSPLTQELLGMASSATGTSFFYADFN